MRIVNLMNLNNLNNLKVKITGLKIRLSARLGGNQGMTLVEIMVALTLLGLVGSFVASKVMESLGEGKQRAAIIQMQNFKGLLQEYRRHCGSYPTTEQGLDALVKKPAVGPECKRYAPNGYVDAIPQDPWDHDYVYESDGKTIKLKSFGADGVEGGEGENRDLSPDDKI
ncbi:MAG: type II secretion system major pseudopilin GspG [Oligoflexia bacterium]|nr:type II secretion system major pseudopilin GspG [Oligoflexia bacterium]